MSFNLKQFFVIFFIDDSQQNFFFSKFIDEKFSQSIFSLITKIENQFQTSSSFIFVRISKINRQRINIDFQLIDELIYHVHEKIDYDIDESRLCISKNC